jgi:hypothetical protein
MGRIVKTRERARNPGGMRTRWGVKRSGHASEKGKRGASIACLAKSALVLYHCKIVDACTTYEYIGTKPTRVSSEKREIHRKY